MIERLGINFTALTHQAGGQEDSTTNWHTPIVFGSCFYWFSFQERELVTQKMASDLKHNDGRKKQSPGFLES